ncbi:dihydroorotate dehydrogenase [Actinoallomurus iriomotensis]|uniref:Dihydroorotate dehydrogenase n=1 Tax=Actinoallomurus iriomotensis TaxID=478107 RepID=A0A9W6RAH3_9ACTN|nr:dihydroorotate dehydrogenase [Actinoallomurus iriomotensis]GLY72029.1 dihydroorotate dehydrogenase B (NAD(+)), catalytic subunit [Actinoallomurus iriomotensis]
MSVDLRTRLGPVSLPNPIMTASGCGGTGRELGRFFHVAKLGAIVTPSITPEPRAGRPAPRLAETPSGVLNSTGLQGPGIDVFLDRDLPWLDEQGARTIVSIAGNSVEEYAEVAKRLNSAPGVTAVEINTSCPNVEDRGLMFAAHPTAAAEVVRAVRTNTRRGVPVFAKLSADVTDVVGVAMACADAGADGLSMINTLHGMAVDTWSFRPRLAGVTGGLSGPAIRPVAVRCVYQVHAALPEVPIIGMGGVRTGTDALELILAGASAVAVGTANLHDPSACTRILRELDTALRERGITGLADAVGLAHKPAGTLIRRIDPNVGVGEPTEQESLQ